MGFSKGVVLLLLLPLAYRCLGRPPNDYVVCLIGMLFNMGEQGETDERPCTSLLPSYRTPSLPRYLGC